MQRIRLIVVIVSSIMLCPCAFAGPDNIDVALTEAVPFLMGKLKEKNIRTVGVLPFRLKQEGKSEQFSGSIVQTNLALRVEQALVVYRDRDQPVDVIFGMLTQARKALPEAQWLTEAGRKELFQLRYELPVGNVKVSPDAFITGVIEVSADWRETTILFECCTAKEPSEHFDSEKYSLKTDRKMLISMGKGFSIPAKLTSSRGIDSAMVMDWVKRDVDFQIQEDQKSGITTPELRVGKSLSQDPFQNAPVTLIVKYDGKTQVFMKDNIPGATNLTINDPKGGQRVTFELKNNTTSRLAVVLSINGRSLLYDEYAANPDELSKFVLDAGRTYRVDGVYQKDHKGVKEVIGLSDSQTSEIAKKIPSEALGMIHMYVYQSFNSANKGSTPSGPSKSDPNGGKLNDNKQAGNQTDKKSNNGSIGNSNSSDTEKQQTIAQSPRFEQSEIEQWKSGFNWALARGSEGESVRANGSFSPSQLRPQVNSWEELAKVIAKNLISGQGSSRGLMIGQGNIQNQEIQTSQIGSVQLTDAYVIRYLSFAK